LAGKNADPCALRQRAEGLIESVGHRPPPSFIVPASSRARTPCVRRRSRAHQSTGSFSSPTTDWRLDRTSATHLTDLLVELNESRKLTLIFVTHAPDLARRMKRVLELVDGQLVETAAAK